jgi:hypothetical protein
MIFTLLLSLIVSLTYLCYTVWVSKGIPVSISDSYYLLGKRGWLFQLVIASVAFMLYPVWVSVCSEELTGLVFGACSSLLFVAVAPCFKLPFEGKVHYTSAIICCVCIVVWQLCMGMCNMLIYALPISIFISCLFIKYWCLCIELGVITSLFITLLQLL